ncbi:Retrovirus-related Pol polyprotein from transposon TNT 1-94 [Senna tora]|uniref:Retrovirus-related Pol polyprotein from transposon TNT 1-94 n=1 Tax=Senna tora TaxID=362788 RepID=A0A834W8X9_9FABA|nr:Retrovirus-related Pol polyprotein from transposon TNT 1-94 [Senna tora]
MAEKITSVILETPQSASSSSVPLVEKEKNAISFNHNLSVKLDEKNYLLWRQQILAALEGHDLEMYVAGSKFIPPRFDTNEDKAAGKLSLSYLKWKKQDKLILSWLLGSMTESMLTRVNECEHSYEAWNIMIEQFGINTKAKVHQFRTELRGIKKGTKSMSEFLLKIKAIAGALRAIGSPISEHEHMQYILEGLPQEYESFVTSANMKTDLTSIGELEALLIAQEVRVDQSLKAVKTTETSSANVAVVDQKDKNTQNRNNQGFNNNFRGGFNNFRGGRNGFNNNFRGGFNNFRGGFGRGRGGSTSNQGFNRPFVVCQVCSRTGHIASACYNRYDSNYQMSQQQYSQNFAQARQRSSGNMTAMIATPEVVNDTAWFPDSGATNHVTSDASNLMNSMEYSGAEQLHMGNGKGLMISNVGQSFVKSSIQPSLNLALNNLLHVPSITKNLISVSKFAKDNSVFFEFHADACFVKSQATKAIILKGSIRSDGLYYFEDFHLLHQLPSANLSQYAQSSNSLPTSSTSPIVLASTIGNTVSNTVTSNSATVTPYTLWHCRLGHCNSATVMEVLKQCNFSISNKSAFEFCEACCNGKHHKLPHPSSPNVYNVPLELIYTDLWGPSPIKSRNGASYYISFIDACSRDVKFDEISFPYKLVPSSTSNTSYSAPSFSSASPPMVVQPLESSKSVAITQDRCDISTNHLVCDNSESTGTDTSTATPVSHSDSGSSEPSNSAPQPVPQTQNVHPMVTRAKAGVFKPKVLLAHVVPTSSKYIQDLLVKSKMDGACAISTPMVANAKLSKDGNNVMSDPSLYRSTVGALQYITVTRPELSFAVNKVCQFMSNPLEEHWVAVKRILSTGSAEQACSNMFVSVQPLNGII